MAADYPLRPQEVRRIPMVQCVSLSGDVDGLLGFYLIRMDPHHATL
jgi:hypothetical protein